uniref:Alpha-galactosidase n=1 Tax=Gracilinema caldarium TaxID=215591 RepID=A0A7C3IHZ2_9SPIR
MEIHGIKRHVETSTETAGLITIRYSISSMEELKEAQNIDEQTAIVIDSLSFIEAAQLVKGKPELTQALKKTAKLAIHPGGYQSWSAGWELVGNESLPRKVHVVPELLKFTNRDGDNPSKGEILGHFIMYIRSGSTYLCFASKEGGELPPITYRIDRQAGRISIEAFARGKTWKSDDTIAEIHLFIAEGFFQLKDTLRGLYKNEAAFAQLSFLRWGSGKERKNGSPWITKKDMPGGFESWYNHYTDINERLILEDLESLGKTENLIKLQYIDRNRPTVFQIDDGWEKAVGHWEIDTQRFPHGLKPIAEAIEAKGYIPGLWLAPFLVTRKSPVFTEHPEWVLKDEHGELVVAGYNDLWDKQFYCLDLSIPAVKDYLDEIIDRAINEWGYRYLKLDFLYAGLFHGAFASGGSAYEHYDAACRILTSRQETKSGLPVAYLGCGVPFGPSYKYFPLSRIGADTKEQWDWFKVRLVGHVGRPAAYVSLHDTIGRSYLDNTIFVNDPDVVFLRTHNCKLTDQEKEVVALTNFMLASQVMFSDDPIQLSPADIELTKRISRLYDELSDEEYGVIRIKRDLFHVFSRSGAVQACINLSGRRARINRLEAPELFDGIETGRPLINHIQSLGKHSATFGGHSITIYRK